jgi:hypothetical protein
MGDDSFHISIMRWFFWISAIMVVPFLRNGKLEMPDEQKRPINEKAQPSGNARRQFVKIALLFPE